MRAWTSSSPAAQSCTSATRPSQRIPKRCYQPPADPGSDTPSSAVAVLEDVALVARKPAGADEGDAKSGQRGDGCGGGGGGERGGVVGKEPGGGGVGGP